MRKRTRKFETARRMPPLHHTLPGQPFHIEDSEVVLWLISRPEIMQYVFDRAAEDCIVYDAQTGTWRGRDYDS